MTLEVWALESNTAGSYPMQRLTTPASTVVLHAIRPHLYKHSTPSGSLYLEVRNSSGTVLATSETIAISTITAASGNYFHGYVRFYTKIVLAASTDYYIALQGSGYTFAESAYVGWCTDVDLRKYTLDAMCPVAFDLEMWSYRNVQIGVYP